MELTEHASGSRVTVTLGEPLTLRLPERGGTGFLWHLDETSASQGLSILHSEMEETSLVPGGSGVRRLTVVATRQGVTELKLDRYRNWEGAAQADAEFTVTLQVGPA